LRALFTVDWGVMNDSSQQPVQPQLLPPQPHRSPTSAEAFAPPEGGGWWRLSPRYRWHRRLTALGIAAPLAALGTLVVRRTGGWPGALAWLAAILLGFGIAWVVAGLSFKAWGFVERQDDLMITSGVFTKRLVIVPYGRMQFVDVSSGLLEQTLGLATVRLHTAAATTDARIPGLPVVVADQLRDRLAARGDIRPAGL
jgi:membrane protein YdbS with pleckstrin-like domain